jgi:hypothetical protein
MNVQRLIVEKISQELESFVSGEPQFDEIIFMVVKV